MSKKRIISGQRVLSALGLTATVLVCQQGFVALAPVAQAYQLDTANHVISVSPSSNPTSDVRNAVTYLVNRSDKSTKWTMRFAAGRYAMTQPMISRNLQNVDFVSDPANPAVLMKASNFSGNEYLFFNLFASNITVRGLTFYGLTNYANNVDPVWPDQGVYFGSSRNITVDNNKFYNFGNAALRVTTDNADSVSGVNSFDTTVTNNTFNNVYQVTTTSNDQIHGATARYLFQNNKLVNLRGSLKFATRTAGAKDVWIRNNDFNGCDVYAIEMDNYNNFEVSGNTIQNVKSVAINMYTNPRAPKGFQWGDGIVVKNNTLRNVDRGIRFSNDPFTDGYTATPHNVVLDGNTLDSVTNSRYTAIGFYNRPVSGVQITNNKLSRIANTQYISTGSATNVTLLGNLVNGVAYGPQPSTPTTPVATKPAAPSALTGQFDGSTKVALSWKDNASNETGQEMWIRPEGGQYALLAKLNPDRTSFTHTVTGTVPTTPWYYAIRSVNEQGASEMSPEFKETFTVTPVATKPAAPSALTGTFDGSTKVALSWKDNANNETGQEMWIRPEGGQYALLAKLNPDRTSFTHTVTGTVPTTPWYYAIRSVNEQGASEMSPEFKETFTVTPVATKPAAPSGLTGQFDGSAKVLLRWKDNATNDTAQEVWIRPEGGQYALLAKLYPDTTSFTHTISGNKPSTPWYYAIRSVNEQGASALSPAVKIDYSSTRLVTSSQ